MTSLLARNMVSVGVAGVYMFGSSGIVASATALSPGSSAGHNMDGITVFSDKMVKHVGDQLGRFHNELDDPVPGDLTGLSKEVADALAATAADAEDTAKEADQVVREAADNELDDPLPGDLAESSKEVADSLAATAADAEDTAKEADQVLEALKSLGFEREAAEMIAGLAKFENQLLVETDGVDHDAAVRAFSSAPPPAEFKEQLKRVKVQIVSRLGSEASEAIGLLTEVTLGEILSTFSRLPLPEKPEVKTFLAMLRSMVLPEGHAMDPKTTLDVLTELLADLEKQLLASVGGANHPYSAAQLTTTYGLSESDAEMLYSVLELEKRVFGPEGLDHDDAERIVLSGSGTRQFAETFDQLKQIEAMLQSAAKADKDLLEAIAIAEIMLRLPAGEGGRQLMRSVRAMVTSGQLTYKQAIQLRDSLPDPTLGDAERESEDRSSSPTTTSTTTTTDEPTSATGKTEVPAYTMEPKASEKIVVEGDANPGVSDQSTSEPEGEIRSDNVDIEVSDKPAVEASADPGLSDQSSEMSELEAAEFEASEENTGESDTESDTDHSLSDQSIMVITIVSVLVLMVAGIVVVAAVRKSRRRSNTKIVTKPFDALPPISSEYENTAIVVDEDVYSDSVDSVA